MNKIVRKSVPLTFRKNEKGQDEIFITTPNPDRSGDCVFPEGCMLDNYLKNPVIMWLHDYRGATASAGIPVGKNSYLKVTAEGIIAGPPIFLDGDPFAERVKNAWDKGFIRTASIGFAPLEEPTLNDNGGYDYKKWEMLEWSLVPIPMNAEACRVAKAAGFEDLVEEEHRPAAISQAAIKDEIDYVRIVLRENSLNTENAALLDCLVIECAAKQKSNYYGADSVNLRVTGGDIPVEIKAQEQAEEDYTSKLLSVFMKT
jgi:hypothetical protein